MPARSVSPRQMCMSEPHTLACATRTRTSRPFGSGSGNSRSSKGFFTPVNTAARPVLAIAHPSLLLAEADEAPRDDHALDLAGAFHDVERLDVAPQFFDQGVAAAARFSEHLEPEAGRLQRSRRAIGLGDGGLERIGLLLVGEVRRPPGEQPAGLDAPAHACETIEDT